MAGFVIVASATAWLVSMQNMSTADDRRAVNRNAIEPISTCAYISIYRIHRRDRTMPLALAEKSCTPCRGGMPPLTQEEAVSYRGQAPDWELLDEAKRIERTYRFKNFREAFAFVERAAALAEAQGHHPEITFGWGYAKVTLHTKKIKGLHENDFIMAAKLDHVAAACAQVTA
jgi:4a-hydroxytetrahydrobiopterin dehydratase